MGPAGPGAGPGTPAHGHPCSRDRTHRPRVPEILGEDLFRADVLSLNGPEERRRSQDVVRRALQLPADAVGVDRVFL